MLWWSNCLGDCIPVKKYTRLTNICGLLIVGSYHGTKYHGLARLVSCIRGPVHRFTDFIIVNLCKASRVELGRKARYLSNLQNDTVLCFLDWPDRTVGLGPDRTGLILVRSGPKVKDRTMKQSPFLVRTGLKLL